MALDVNKIKKNFARNKRRWMLIVTLSLVLAGLSVKAYMDMKPRSASAQTSSAGAANAKVTGIGGRAVKAPLTAAQVDAKIEQSYKLWQTLRVERGVPVKAAFQFVPMYYSPDPTPRAAAARNAAADAPMCEISSTPVLVEGSRESNVRQAAKKLIVNSTIVGSGKTRPVAVVNGKILTVGDRIDKFEIVNIKAREVVFKLDGVTVTVEMANVPATSTTPK